MVFFKALSAASIGAAGGIYALELIDEKLESRNEISSYKEDELIVEGNNE